MRALLNTDIKGGWAIGIVAALLIAVFLFIGKQVKFILKKMDQDEYKEQE